MVGRVVQHVVAQYGGTRQHAVDEIVGHATQGAGRHTQRE